MTGWLVRRSTGWLLGWAWLGCAIKFVEQTISYFRLYKFLVYKPKDLYDLCERESLKIQNRSKATAQIVNIQMSVFRTYSAVVHCGLILQSAKLCALRDLCFKCTGHLITPVIAAVFFNTF